MAYRTIALHALYFYPSQDIFQYMTKDMTFSASTGIHQGDRETQQDRVHIFINKREPNCILAIVADGMGGLTGGRQASDQVMQTAEQLFRPFNSKTDDAKQLLDQIVQQAHTVIGLCAMTSEQQPHSTFAAFLITTEGACHWAHVGDSRLYYFSHGQLIKRSKDHSYVQALVDCGELTEAAALNHKKANILTRSLGSKLVPNVEHALIQELHPGDCIMACSDGLWAYFSAEELGMVLNAESPREAAESLVITARSRSKNRGDNLSLAIVKCH